MEERGLTPRGGGLPAGHQKDPCRGRLELAIATGKPKFFLLKKEEGRCCS